MGFRRKRLVGFFSLLIMGCIILLVIVSVHPMFASSIYYRLAAEVTHFISPDVFPRSDQGIRHYSQGGVVVDQVAYFAADHNAPLNKDHERKSAFFPSIVSFSASPPFKKYKSFKFKDTYDSGPLCLTTKAGKTLVIGHEFPEKRTKAVNVATGETEWVSKANQHGPFFFGYACFTLPEGDKILLGAFHNGLHALRLDDGKEVWFIPRKSIGGVSPCVDQERYAIFYQFDGGLAKIDALRGTIIKEIAVPAPKKTISWNTVLVNDRYGYFVATYWYGDPEWDSAVRVYDENLALAWEETGLPAGKKATLTYAHGLLLTGTGNGWSQKYTGNDWKRLKAWSIQDGALAWECDLSGYDFRAIYNVPYFNGFFYAETQDPLGFTSKLFRIGETDGRLDSVLEYGFPITSCAPSLIARGMMYSGDILADRIVVTRLAYGSQADWVGPFSDPRTNQNAVVDEKGVRNVEMRIVAQ